MATNKLHKREIIKFRITEGTTRKKGVKSKQKLHHKEGKQGDDEKVKQGKKEAN